MLPDDQEGFLADILIYARKILTFTQGVSEATVAANEGKQLAVIRCLPRIPKLHLPTRDRRA
jgi:uncharacterized protein with HEPN domain